MGFFQHQIFHTNQIQIRLLQAFTIYHHVLIPVLRIPEPSQPECLESLASDPFYLQVVNFNATNDKSNGTYPYIYLSFKEEVDPIFSPDMELNYIYILHLFVPLVVY